MHAALAPHETLLDGAWPFENGDMRGDAVEDRIDWLTSEQLVQAAVHPEHGAWEILYRDPTDGRFWELTYPQSEMHGGGPRRLHVLARDEASVKYGLHLG